MHVAAILVRSTIVNLISLFPSMGSPLQMMGWLILKYIIHFSAPYFNTLFNTHYLLLKLYLVCNVFFVVRHLQCRYTRYLQIYF